MPDLAAAPGHEAIQRIGVNFGIVLAVKSQLRVTAAQFPEHLPIPLCPRGRISGRVPVIFRIADPGAGTGQLIEITSIHPVVGNGLRHGEQTILPIPGAGTHHAVDAAVILVVALSAGRDDAVFQERLALGAIHIIVADGGDPEHPAVEVGVDVDAVFHQFRDRLPVPLADGPIRIGAFVHVVPLAMP